VDEANHASFIAPKADKDRDTLPGDVLAEEIFVERYEKKLMAQVDNDLLRRIFPGWRKNDQD
jgi:hypothetical protein